jgi:serine phosphatase RsbU (regulator of sigma subunit)
MSAQHDEDDDTEVTNIVSRDTLKVKMDPNYRVPPCLVMVDGPTDLMGRQWPFDKATIIMGRASGADIHISEPSLSKSHARFESIKGQVTITDLGATNGTLVNSKPLQKNFPYVLKNNDQIMTGSVVFKFLERGILSETTEKARMQNELETARTVQETLFPSQPDAKYMWVDISGRYRSASECGGDWWWHWSCGGKAFAIIGDATGHGAAAALLTSAARSAMGTIEDDPTVGVEKVYSTLSPAISKCSGGKLTMSAFIVEVDLATRKIRYINASHLPSAILSKTAKEFDWKKLDSLQDPISPMLGSTEVNYQVGEAIAGAQSRLILLTDGLTERKDIHGASLKEREFNQMLIESHCAHLHLPKPFLDSLLRKSDRKAGRAPQDDDITVVALDFT